VPLLSPSSGESCRLDRVPGWFRGRIAIYGPIDPKETMHVLFVHQNFPAQFGHIARHLIRTLGWSCTFVSKTPPGVVDGIRKVAYTTRGGARETTHYCSRTFENAVWHSHGVYEACKAAPDPRPDLIVGHSGFGSTLFLPELYPRVPIVNYFEFYYHPHQSDMDFRPEFPPADLDYLRARARNAMLLLDLENCRRGYSPTHFQRQLFPETYRPKIEVIFDGIETDLFRRLDDVPRRIGNRSMPPSTRIVTYVSRGFESMRGFDIFMRVAKSIYQQFPDVLFVVVGSDRVCYGGDEKHIQHKTFYEHVMAQSSYDPDKFLFTGLVPVTTLVELLSLSDLHLYFTVPFVLSWSLMDALACGCTVLASDTAPVREMIEDDRNGRLCGFYDVEGFATRAVEVLRDPGAFRHLGREAADRIRRHYAIDVTLPRLARLFAQAVEAT
jgi:glycosyltransferase involved in cell wall biosynthesis